MNFYEAKRACADYGAFDKKAMYDTDKDKMVDRCRLTGAKCEAKKCPAFHAYVKPAIYMAVEEESQ